MQRTYELMFIIRPDMPEEDQDKLISNLETQVGTAGRNGEELGTHGQAPAGLHGRQVPGRHLYADDTWKVKAAW